MPVGVFPKWTRTGLRASRYPRSIFEVFSKLLPVGLIPRSFFEPQAANYEALSRFLEVASGGAYFLCPNQLTFEIPRAGTAFLEIDPNGSYDFTANQRNLRGFSNLVWVGLVLGTKTRKKTSPIQVNLEFPLASVLRNTVPARGKPCFGLKISTQKQGYPKKGRS